MLRHLNLPNRSWNVSSPQKDPVCFKLVSILNGLNKEYKSGWEGSFRKALCNYMGDIACREMTEDVYTDLLNTSERNLVKRLETDASNEYLEIKGSVKFLIKSFKNKFY